MELLGHTLEFIGVILIAYTALRVHTRVQKDHKIDNAVVDEMKKERLVGILGIVLIVLGYVLQVHSKL